MSTTTVPPFPPPPPPPAQPPNYSPFTPPSGTLMGAIRGPILMMALGGLLALDSMGGMSFHRTWPVLLIVFGVLKLAERAQGPLGPIQS